MARLGRRGIAWALALGGILVVVVGGGVAWWSGERSGPGRLIEALEGDDLAARIAACRALEKMGAGARDALPALVRAHAEGRRPIPGELDDDRRLERAAQRAIKAIGPSDAAQTIAERARAGDARARRWGVTLLAALELPVPPDLLIRQLDDWSASTRRDAAARLRASASPEATQALLARLRERDARRARQAFEILAGRRPLSPLAMEGLFAALRTRGALGADSRAWDRLRGLPVGEVVDAAVGVMRATGARGSRNPRACDAAARFLVSLGADAVPAVGRALEDGSPRVRQAILAALARAGERDHAGLVPGITRALGSADAALQAVGIRALGRLTPDPERAVGRLMSLLDDGRATHGARVEARRALTALAKAVDPARRREVEAFLARPASRTGLGIVVERTADRRAWRVTSVERYGPAARCGLLVNDRIIRVNGRDTLASSVERGLRDAPGREPVAVEVVRDGQRRVLTVALDWR